jgi:hypothetical protein
MYRLEMAAEWCCARLSRFSRGRNERSCMTPLAVVLGRISITRGRDACTARQLPRRGIQKCVQCHGGPGEQSRGSVEQRNLVTSRAQARGAKGREPRSGTGCAIPRCLQRFVRPRRSHLPTISPNFVVHIEDDLAVTVTAILAKPSSNPVVGQTHYRQPDQPVVHAFGEALPSLAACGRTPAHPPGRDG